MYISPRLLPSLGGFEEGDQSILLSSQTLRTTAGDRLDLISARSIGDSEQFWRICDVNLVMHPLQLTDNVGTEIRLPIIGLVQDR